MGAEGRRKMVHIAMLGFALLLRPLPWPGAAAMALLALLYNAFILRRLHGDALLRDDERGARFARGIVYYPLAILGLVLIFRIELVVVGAAWAVLALGDGLAAVAGRAVGGPALPWNARKTWAGTTTFVAAGGVGAWALGTYLRAETRDGVALGMTTLVVAAVLASLVAAIFESLPLGVDDNLVVPTTAAAAYWLAIRTDPAVLTSPALLRNLAVGVAVAAVTGLAAWRARSVDAAGFLAGVGVGASVWLGGGLAGFLTLLAFFVLGVGATRIGYRDKAARGLAEARGGRRTWIHVLANGLTGAGACLAAALVPDLRAVFVLAFVASFATAGSDTVASEIGKRFGRTAYLPTTLRRVAPGTEGAVSLEGSLAGIGAAFAIPAVAVAGGLIAGSGLVFAGLAAVLGNYLESLVGHLVGAGTEMENEVLNFLNTLAGAVLAVLMATTIL